LKILAAVFADPISGNIEWRKIEALFKAAGCQIIEGSSSRDSNAIDFSVFSKLI